MASMSLFRLSPDIRTYRETLEEAREMARDAIRCYLESALKTGEPITPASEV